MVDFLLRWKEKKSGEGEKGEGEGEALYLYEGNYFALVYSGRRHLFIFFNDAYAINVSISVPLRKWACFPGPIESGVCQFMS